MTKDEYQRYLKSEHWQYVRRCALRRAGNRCQVCNTNGDTLDVHHRTYDHLGDEWDSDVVVLCRRHHEMFHDPPVADGELLERVLADMHRITEVLTPYLPSEVAVSPSTPDGRKQCDAWKKNGERCRNFVNSGVDYCEHHIQPSSRMTDTPTKKVVAKWEAIVSAVSDIRTRPAAAAVQVVDIKGDVLLLDLTASAPPHYIDMLVNQKMDVLRAVYEQSGVKCTLLEVSKVKK